MPTARVSWPDARVMADGRVRVPLLGATVIDVSGTSWVQWPPASGWEVEIVPDPEPKWEHGDVVRDANGVVFWRTEADRWRDVSGMGLEPVRPLTRLIPQP
jgi:hypothetical protein